MKIALISDGIYPYVIGGMQKHSASIGIELVKLGFSVDLYHFVYKSNSIPTIEDVNKFHFDSTKGFNKIYCSYFPTSLRFPGHYLWNSFRYSKWVFNTINNNNNKYDFIYSKGFSSWKLLQRRKDLKYKSKIGVKFHGYEMYQAAPSFKIKIQHFVLRPFVKMINKKADYIFSYGGKITSIIKDLNINPNKIIELSSGISESWLINKKIDLKNDNLKILFIGRNERRKAYNEICDAINLFKNNNLEFHFIGPIPINKQITSSIHKIIYYGSVNDEQEKKNIFDKCDILLCPSYSEGMPNVILEAMSRGLIIIATDVGATSVLVNQDNGILLRNNTPFHIKEAIKYLISLDSKNLIIMKKNSIKKIKSYFIWNKLRKQIFDTLHRIVN
jgi:glycosyltransferase involved in cell wall biosynthesis